MNETSTESKRPRLSDSAKGTLYCILSDTIFSFSYFFVRVLTAYPEVHRDWTFCFKETITTLGAFPIFFILWRRGKCSPPAIKIIALILVAAFFCEFVGVRAHISAFAAIGIMLGNPLIRTFTILGTALIGIFALREKLTRMKLLTITVLVCAIFMLGFSQSKKPAAETAALPASEKIEEAVGPAGEAVPVPEIEPKNVAENVPASKQAAKPGSEIIPAFLVAPTSALADSLGRTFGVQLTPLFVFGLLMALVTGAGYAIYTVLLRYILRKAVDDGSGVKKEPVPIFFIVSAVCGFGAIVGAIFLYKDRGWEGFVDVPPVCWLYVGLAGALNVVCFYLKNLSLRYATASKVATFSVLQIFLATMFGLLWFGEPVNALVYSGLALIVLGIVLASRTS